MTGVEKLRKLVRDIEPDVRNSMYAILREGTEPFWGVSYEHDATLRETLEAIADQIEREAKDRGADTGVHRAIDELRRWDTDYKWDCRGDRYAIEQAGVVERLADKIESECEEDARAAKWVLENGGLEQVKLRDEFATEALWWLRKVSEVPGGKRADVDEMMTDVENRLMPQGMEWLLEVWPKWSNGEYCKFGDLWISPEYGYGRDEPKQLRRLAIYSPEQLKELGQDEGDNFGYEWDFMRPADTSYRPEKVKPEPSDSWERLEEDARLDPCDYFGKKLSRECADCPASCLDSCVAQHSADLVRRAKALAERERGE